MQSTPQSNLSPSHDSEVVPTQVCVRDRHRFHRWLLLILALTTLCYARSLSSPLYADDYNWLARSARALRDPWLPFTAVFGRDYNPLSYLSFTSSYRLFRTWPPGWHSLCLVLHLACTALTGILAARLTRSRPAGILAALLFGTHVAISEPVLFSSANVHSQALLFILAAVLCHTSRSRPLVLVCFPIAFIVALNFKETALGYAIVLPATALACRLKRLETPLARRGPALAAFLIGSTYAASRLLLPVSHAARSISGTSLRTALGKTALTLTSFAGLDGNLPDNTLLLFLIAVPIATALLATRHPATAFGCIWSLVFIAVHFPASKHSSRYCYLPWPGLCLLAAQLLLAAGRRLQKRLRFLPVALAIAIAIWSAAAIQREIDDYRMLGTICEEELRGFAPLAAKLVQRFQEGGPLAVAFLEAHERSPLAETVPKLLGRPKLIAYRRKGVAGLITFEDLMAIQMAKAQKAFPERLPIDSPLFQDRRALFITYRDLDRIEIRPGPVARDLLSRLDHLPGERLSCIAIVGF